MSLLESSSIKITFQDEKARAKQPNAERNFSKQTPETKTLKVSKYMPGHTTQQVHTFLRTCTG